MTDDNDRSESATCAKVTAAWLGLGTWLDLTSLALSALALAVLFVQDVTATGQIGLVLGFLFGVVEKFYALRAAFDRKLFQAWAGSWTTEMAAPATDMAQLDAALAALGLRSTDSAPPRNLPARMHGARRLLKIQAAALAMQCTTLMITALLMSKHDLIMCTL